MHGLTLAHRAGLLRWGEPRPVVVVLGAGVLGGGGELRVIGQVPDVPLAGEDVADPGATAARGAASLRLGGLDVPTVVPVLG